MNRTQLTAVKSIEPTSSQSRTDQLVSAATAHTRRLRHDLLKRWAAERVDIRLAPISCVDVYRELVINRSALILQPEQLDDSGATRLRPTPAGILPTQHDTDRLKLRCRKIEIETSTKSPVLQYQLYLVAGFAMAANASGDMHRIPLLLIPAHITRANATSDHYQVSYSGKQLRLNPQIAAACHEPIEEQFDAFSRDNDLRDYLRALNRKLHNSLRCRVSANTGLFTLQADVLHNFTAEEKFDIALNRSTPGTKFRPLPPQPVGFDAPLASLLLRYIPAEALPAALHDFTAHAQTSYTTNSQRLTLSDPAKTDEKLQRCARWLHQLGLGRWSLKGVQALPARVQQMRNAITDLQQSQAYNQYFRKEDQNLGLLLRQAQCTASISSAPADMHQHAISLHGDPNTRVLLQKVKLEAAVLESEMTAMQQTFHINAIPNSEVLTRLIDIISARETEPQLTNPLYFKARRRLNDILQTHNGLVTDDDLTRLRSLAENLSQSEAFAADLYYRRCFGTLYKGIHTNWQRLDTLVDYSRGLAQQLASESIAGKLLETWPSFIRDLQGFESQLSCAAIAGWQLSVLLPDVITPQSSLSAILRSADKYQQKVSTWEKYINTTIAREDTTALQILATLGTPIDDDVASVRLPEPVYHDQVLRHIVNCGVNLHSLDITANWLLHTLEHLSIDQPTVRRYLDAEASLATNGGKTIAI